MLNFLKVLNSRISGWVKKRIVKSSNLRAAVFWVAAFVTGAVSVGYAGLFRWVEGWFRSLLDLYPLTGWILPPIGFMAAWALVRWVAPEAGGSGIPQVLAANDLADARHTAFVKRLLSIKTAAVKIVSSLLCLLGGGAIGREGPTLQISAAIFHFFGRFTRRFHSAHDLRPWIVAGSAAGLASAFNTPLGGIVYAIEEMNFTHFQRLKIPLFAAVIIAGVVSQWLHGSYLYLGFPKIGFTGLFFLPLALTVGVAGGILGALFGKILVFGTGKLKSIRTGRRGVWVALVCGLLLSVLIALDHRAAGSGKGLIVSLLFEGRTAGADLVLIRFASTLVSYFSGAAAGIFAPSLAIGATLGAWLANVFHSPHTNLMVMLGMIGFLTGVTRTPFTSFVLVLEMTDRHSAIFFMMLAAVGANSAALLVDRRSFYEQVCRRLEEEAEVEAARLPEKHRQPET